MHLQIVYFPEQYQLRECRRGRAGIGMEVRKEAVRWAEGGRGMWRGRTPISASCASNCSCFSLSLLSNSVSNLRSYFVLFHQPSCKGCIRGGRSMLKRGLHFAKAHLNTTDIIQLYEFWPGKSIFTCLNDSGASSFLTFLLHPTAFPQFPCCTSHILTWTSSCTLRQNVWNQNV